MNPSPEIPDRDWAKLVALRWSQDFDIDPATHLNTESTLRLLRLRHEATLARLEVIKNSGRQVPLYTEKYAGLDYFPNPIK